MAPIGGPLVPEREERKRKEAQGQADQRGKVGRRNSEKNGLAGIERSVGRKEREEEREV